MLKGINYMWHNTPASHCLPFSVYNRLVSSSRTSSNTGLAPSCVGWPSVGGGSYTPYSQIGRWTIYAIQQDLL